MTLINLTVCNLGIDLHIGRNYDGGPIAHLWINVPFLIHFGIVSGHPRHGAYVLAETHWHRAHFGTRGYKLQRSNGGTPPIYTTLKCSGVDG